MVLLDLEFALANLGPICVQNSLSAGAMVFWSYISSLSIIILFENILFCTLIFKQSLS